MLRGWRRRRGAGIGDMPSGTSGGAATRCCPNLSFRHLANWFMSCAAVAWMMPTPRPYCATEPDSVRLVCTSTLLPSPAGSSRNSAVALAPPRPLASLPCAEIRALWLRVVDLLELDGAGEGQRHRAEPHRDAPLVGGLVDHLGQFRARHARRDALDVEQHLPRLGRRQRHLERIVEFHAAPV